MICTCPTSCDCENPELGWISNHCPIHNLGPAPYPDCPVHGVPPSRRAITEPCDKCGGSGFSGYGSGYGDVCGECAGGEQFVEWADEKRERLIATAAIQLLPFEEMHEAIVQELATFMDSAAGGFGETVGEIMMLVEQGQTLSEAITAFKSRTARGGCFVLP